MVEYSEGEQHVDTTYIPDPDDVAYLVHSVNGKTAVITGLCDDTIIPTTNTLIENNATVILACNDTQITTKLKHTNKNQPNLIIKHKLNISDLLSIHTFITNIESKYQSLNILINNGININYNNSLGHFYLINKLTNLLSNSSQISRVINIPINNSKNNTHIIFTNEYNKRYNNNNIHAVSLKKQSQMANILKYATTINDEKYIQLDHKFFDEQNENSLYENVLDNKLGEKLWNWNMKMIKQRGFVV